MDKSQNVESLLDEFQERVIYYSGIRASLSDVPQLKKIRESIVQIDRDRRKCRVQLATLRDPS